MGKTMVSSWLKFMILLFCISQSLLAHQWYGSMKTDNTRKSMARFDRPRRMVGGGQAETFSMEATGLGDLEEADALRKMLRRNIQMLLGPRRGLLTLLAENRSAAGHLKSSRSYPFAGPYARRNQELVDTLRRMLDQSGHSYYQGRGISLRTTRAQDGDQRDDLAEVLQSPLPFEEPLDGNSAAEQISSLTMRKIPDRRMGQSLGRSNSLALLLDGADEQRSNSRQIKPIAPKKPENSSIGPDNSSVLDGASAIQGDRDETQF